MWRKWLIASTHLAVGAASGLMVQRFFPSDMEPVLKRLCFGFVAGYASHLLLDSFPHQEYVFEGLKLAPVLFVEITMTFFLFLFFRKPTMVNLIIFFGMAGGAMPDVVYFANKHLLGWAHLGDLGSVVHLFSHDAVPLGFDVSIYIQLLLALGAYCFVRLKLRPVK